MDPSELRAAKSLLFIDAPSTMLAGKLGASTEKEVAEKAVKDASSIISTMGVGAIDLTRIDVISDGYTDGDDVVLQTQLDHINVAVKKAETAKANLTDAQRMISTLGDQFLNNYMVSVVNTWMSRSSINDYLGKLDVKVKFGPDQPLPKKLAAHFQNNPALVQFTSLAQLNNSTLHGFFTEALMSTKFTDKNTKNGLLRFIQSARHSNSLDKQLLVKHDGEQCTGCKLNPLAGCYWLPSPVSKEKYCFKCYVRGRPVVTVGQVKDMTHISFKGKTATAADSLLWNE